MKISIVNLDAVFLSDMAITAFLLIGIILYMYRPLRTLLIELCGKEERANFWLAFSNVTLLVVPLIFALDFKPEFGPDKTVILEVAAQLKYALTGFIITLGGLGFVLYRFLPRDKAQCQAK